MKTNAFAYLRVSGKGQIAGDGFTRQETAIRKHAAENGMNIVRLYKEKGVSGAITNRPVLAEMMLDMEEDCSGVKTIIIERLDRLSRDLMVQESIIADLQKHDYSLVSATDPDNLLSNDPTRVLIRQILGAIAQYDKAMTVQKLWVARERKRLKNGKCEGRKGYSELAPEIIAEIRKLNRKPRKGRRRSRQEICDILNEKGFLTITGKAFSPMIISNILRKKTA